MHSTILKNTTKCITKLTDKAKAAVDERLKITSKKRKNTGGSNGTIHTQPKKAKSTQEHGTNSVEEASTEPHGRTIEQAPPKAHPAPSQRAVVHSEDEDEVLNNEAIVISDEEETAKEELERLMKEWNSPIYVFFDPTPTICYSRRTPLFIFLLNLVLRHEPP
ncbi:hypothetical protein BDR03DRAFT_1016837 [Suillus americanus]|nr:hypothetical protein BDR03DRAFT_1016837 [Suillus americanus]